jgi:cyclopropane-fatty-acyl-phospholipid synthase
VATGAGRSQGGVLEPASLFDRLVLQAVCRELSGLPLALRLWDGTAAELAPEPVAEVVLKSRRSLLGLVRDPQLGFGDAYTSGALEVRGDLVRLLEEIYRHWGETRCGRPRRHAAALRRPGNTLQRSRENIHHHYDIGNDFYRLWLDRQLVYTCAYFPTPEASLEEAQVAKMDHVCRKLRLRPGERVVEAGCGWGALALHMARHYGVDVLACNISTEQIQYARLRAEREGLSSRIEFVEDDYRNLRGPCDAFVSIGMLEHVGPDNYEALGAVVDRCLGARGRGLLHFIGRDTPRPLNAWIRKRIFPGAYPPSLGEVSEAILEPRAFSVLDVENLRLHYALTLSHWLERYEKAADAVERMFDAAFVRAWRLYLAGSQVSFATGTLQLFQVTFARAGSSDAAWTRAELYR